MNKINLQKELNKEQLNAVLTTTGPLVVLAGAGSGKTRVITYRIYNLINNHEVSPTNILGVTFTNKAADEMRERVKILCGSDGGYVTLSTFHSLGSKILRETSHLIGYENNFSIYDQSDQTALVKNVLKRLNLSSSYYEPKGIVHKINLLKNEMIGVNTISSVEEDKNIRDIYKLYETLLKQNNAMDFGDLLLKLYTLFKENENILSFYQEKYRYIMVDEFQDTNLIQYELIRMLSSKYKNVCIVGDDDQAIYSWRGAEPTNLIKFTDDFDNTKLIKLEENYRSTSVILNIANEIIKNNKVRMDKVLRSNKKRGVNATISKHHEERKQAKWVVRKIREVVDNNNIRLNNIAVFYRMNFQSRLIEEELAKYRIPYQVVGSLKFYDRKETKDILAYMRVIDNPRDDLDLLRIINTPRRKIGKKKSEELGKIAHKENLSLFETMEYIVDKNDEYKALAKIIEPFYKLLKSYIDEKTKLNPYELISQLITEIDYEDYLYNYDKYEAESRIGNVNELLNSLKDYIDTSEEPTLGKYLERISLITDADTVDEGNHVYLMTFHAAKGLEFPVVFIVGLNEGILPHERSKPVIEQFEEERRLFYVGVTRAKDKLFLSFTETKMQYGRIDEAYPSSFIDEIPEDLLSWDGSGISRKKIQPNKQELKGTLIDHPKYGKGLISKIDGNYIIVIFRNVGEKKFKKEFIENLIKKR